MIPNCKGCKYEIDDAYYHQQEYGLHLATTKDYPSSERIGIKGHFFMMMVNNEGKIVIQ